MYEDKSLQEVLNAPPSALAGLTERHNQVLSEASALAGKLWAPSVSVSYPDARLTSRTITIHDQSVLHDVFDRRKAWTTIALRDV